jgi:ATP-dependent 26S proteasome regulatory subunit
MNHKIEPLVEEPAVRTPSWFPAWATQLADLYFSGTTCLFVLHGNVNDFIRCTDADGTQRFVSLDEFLASQIFGNWGVVLGYDLGTGLRLMPGGDSSRLQGMVQYVSSRIGNPAGWSQSPEKVFAQLDRLIEHGMLRDDKSQREELAILFPHAQYLIPTAEISALAGSAGARLVRMLKWAQSPYIRRMNVAFCLIVDKLSELNERLVANPHVAAIEVPLPNESDRQQYIETSTHGLASDVLGEFTADSLARLSSGLNLVSLNSVLSRARSGRGSLDANRFKQLKKSAIERHCQGLVEFVEPKHTLDLIVGHDAAKQRLQEDSRWIGQGHLESSPMGYLLCGPVGTGKTFLAECYAGSIGIPCVKLRNFRSKYVGETEGNLEQVLTVLRSLGPIMVIIDEADAMLGDRRASGDSGTSGRVFSMIASQMGDTQYRGRIIWMLLTCRPDLLPIDLKRQGRAEVHIPLFYPQEQSELQEMFRVMARKNKAAMTKDAVGEIPLEPALSGADVESVVLSARRAAMTAGRDTINRTDLRNALDSFIPSAQGLEKELQETVAVLECTDRAFLTDAWREQLAQPNGRSLLQERAVAIRQIIED